MIVHIGWDVPVSLERVVAVLNARSALKSRDTANLIQQAKAEGRFTPCPEGEKAYVLLCDGGDAPLQVLASAISPATLLKRLERPVWDWA